MGHLTVLLKKFSRVWCMEPVNNAAFDFVSHSTKSRWLPPNGPSSLVATASPSPLIGQALDLPATASSATPHRMGPRSYPSELKSQASVSQTKQHHQTHPEWQTRPPVAGAPKAPGDGDARGELPHGNEPMQLRPISRHAPFSGRIRATTTRNRAQRWRTAARLST